MPTIGETLREARMRQGLDVADVEAATKIRAKYLRALENEEFGMLPGPTFVKTFIRTYAEQLGLDPQRLLDAYRHDYESGDELEQLQPLGPPGSRGRDRRQRAVGRGGPRPGAIAAIVVVVVLVVLVVLGLTADDGKQDGEGGQVSQTEPKRTSTTDRRSRRERQLAPTQVALRIVPREATYVCVDSGAGTDVRFEGVLDGLRTFRGKLVRLNLGKTSAKLTVNGKPLAVSPGPDPVGFELRPGHARPLPLGERPCA
jgi:cytoskeleton protein RodZ